MCGLYGIASSSLTPAERDVYYSLAVLSCFRGTDSTGCAAVTREKDGKLQVKSFKSIDNPVSFVESSSFHKTILEHNPLILMGHSRAATIGKISAANAHPFKVKHLIGMHNGTVPSLGSKDKTDSEMLYGLIAEKGISALDSLTGAWALSWFDTESKTINFFRNYQRPLYYMIGGANLLVWASESKMLEYVKQQHNMLYSAKITEFEANVHHQVKFADSCVRKKTSTNVPDDKVLLPPPPAADTSQVPFLPDKAKVPLVMYPTIYPYRQEIITPVKQEVRKSDTEKVTSALFKYKGFRGEELTVQEYKDILNGGCAYCEEEGSIVANNFFVDRREYLCPKCQRTPEGSMFMHTGDFVKLSKRTDTNA